MKSSYGCFFFHFENSFQNKYSYDAHYYNDRSEVWTRIPVPNKMMFRSVHKSFSGQPIKIFFFRLDSHLSHFQVELELLAGSLT